MFSTVAWYRMYVRLFADVESKSRAQHKKTENCWLCSGLCWWYFPATAKHRKIPPVTPLLSQVLDDPDYSLVKALQTAQQNFVITDPTLPDNPIVFASQGFLELTGYTLDQVGPRIKSWQAERAFNQSHVDFHNHLFHQLQYKHLHGIFGIDPSFCIVVTSIRVFLLCVVCVCVYICAVLHVALRIYGHDASLFFVFEALKKKKSKNQAPPAPAKQKQPRSPSLPPLPSPIHLPSLLSLPVNRVVRAFACACGRAGGCACLC